MPTERGREMTFDVIVLSIISSVVIYLLWIINISLYKTYLAINTLIVLSLPDDNATKKHVIESFNRATSVPITRFNL